MRVPAEKLDCGNGTMNEHMWKAIKAKDAPTIEFRVTGYDVDRADGVVHGTLNGTLSLGGVQHPVAVRAEGRPDASGALHVVGSHEIRMTEFGLKPPSLMMGTMKVDERVKVSFELYLKG